MATKKSIPPSMFTSSMDDGQWDEAEEEEWPEEEYYLEEEYPEEDPTICIPIHCASKPVCMISLASKRYRKDIQINLDDKLDNVICRILKAMCDESIFLGELQLGRMSPKNPFFTVLNTCIAPFCTLFNPPVKPTPFTPSCTCAGPYKVSVNAAGKTGTCMCGPDTNDEFNPNCPNMRRKPCCQKPVSENNKKRKTTTPIPKPKPKQEEYEPVDEPVYEEEELGEYEEEYYQTSYVTRGRPTSSRRSRFIRQPMSIREKRRSGSMHPVLFRPTLEMISSGDDSAGKRSKRDVRKKTKKSILPVRKKTMPLNSNSNKPLGYGFDHDYIRRPDMNGSKDKRTALKEIFHRSSFNSTSSGCDDSKQLSRKPIRSIGVVTSYDTLKPRVTTMNTEVQATHDMFQLESEDTSTGIAIAIAPPKPLDVKTSLPTSIIKRVRKTRPQLLSYRQLRYRSSRDTSSEGENQQKLSKKPKQMKFEQIEMYLTSDAEDVSNTFKPVKLKKKEPWMKLFPGKKK